MNKTTPINDQIVNPDDYKSAADEFAKIDALKAEEETAESEEEDTDGENGSGDGKKPSLKNYKVVLDKALLDFAKDDKLSPLDALIDIINRLKLAAPSEIVKGNSTFGPEHPDLTLRELGILTKRLSPENVADPHLLKKLDAAQRELMARENIPHPDDWMKGDASGRSGVSEAIVGFILGSLHDKDKSQQERQAQKREKKENANRLIKDKEIEEKSSGYKDEKPSVVAAAFKSEPSISDRTSELMSPKPTADMSDMMNMFDDDLQFDKPANNFDNDKKTFNIINIIDVPKFSINDFDDIRSLFNAIVSVDYNNQPIIDNNLKTAPTNEIEEHKQQLIKNLDI